ncbi:hypothetical protein TSAR_005816 [Trichomalopsis sarcophagae]|uniref:Partial AB-hydrolase lipase domain-containing protein n=1 Tax=Trichomalopsis sarcophagae TaxID=543379 RepID=A0A232FMJ8_9HYME|nr:hypothetical protein TSAR_005816 [Trichomalopsis sarcophagae]
MICCYEGINGAFRAHVVGCLNNNVNLKIYIYIRIKPPTKICQSSISECRWHIRGPSLISLSSISVHMKGFVTRAENTFRRYLKAFLKTEMIRKQGYIAEEHLILTEDGYLLTLHRIPGSTDSPIVLLEHGLLLSSFDYTANGKDEALAFFLADKGYDVWMGNLRGNIYSRCHIKYLTTDNRFWNFSFHEMGIYDLPAQIKYITDMKNDDIVYVGHSMGTTTFYVMAIERPDIASKVKAMFGLAPVAFVNHIKGVTAILVPLASFFNILSQTFTSGAVFSPISIRHLLIQWVCTFPFIKEICADIIFIIGGFNAPQLNYVSIPLNFYTIYDNMLLSPKRIWVEYGLRTKKYAKLRRSLLPPVAARGRYIASDLTSKIAYFWDSNTALSESFFIGKLRYFDYGKKGNRIMYNSSEVPEYDVTKIKVPIGIFYSDNDFLATPEDARDFYKLMLYKILAYKVPDPNFSHFDFVWVMNAKNVVYKKLLSVMKNYQ